MSVLVTIGDFSRMTYLSVKMLRHYHEIGLLEPHRVDPESGYRLYDASQVATAQVIRRLRELEMPLDEVRSVLDADDLQSRNSVVLGHLERMQRQLAATQDTVSTLQALLSGPAPGLSVVYRSEPAFRAVTATAEVSMEEPSSWYEDLFGRLHASEAAIRRAGPDGAMYHPDYFQAERGRVVAFIPLRAAASVADGGEVAQFDAVDYAVAVHAGSFESIDRTYGALGTFVAEQAIGIAGPIRENYLDPDPRNCRVEVCWPIFRVQRP